jgi:hypothetical protein
MRVNPAIKIAYASKYASSANAYKKWIGVNLGMDRTDGLAQLRARQESRLLPAGKESTAWLDSEMSKASKLLTSRELWVESIARGWELGQLVALVNSKGTPAEIQQSVEAFYKEYNPELDRRALKKTVRYWLVEAPQQFPGLLVPAASELTTDINGLYNGLLAQPDASLKLLQSDFALWLSTAKQDPAYQAYTKLNEWQTSALLPGIRDFNKTAAPALRQHMERFLQAPDAAQTLYPDANSTLRLATGTVRPYAPADGVEYGYQTTLDGYMAKYIPGDYEFDVDPKVQALYRTKSYGRYALPNGQLPVCFIASNHTSGGNSGSPALDAKGRLIGINFDRVWEGTMSDYRFDESICRNVMVDIRFVLWTIEKVGDAPHLVEEMALAKGR